MPHKILFKFATRERPKKFFEGLNNILTYLGNKIDYQILITADKNDPSMYNKDVLLRLKPYLKNHNVKILFGDGNGGIEAVNRDINTADPWDILVHFSDDMEYLSVGFDNVIREKFDISFSNLDGNVFFNDGFSGDKVSTMPIIGREYYRRFGYALAPVYDFLFAHQEYTEVAIMLQRIKYFDLSLYRHNHPTNVGGEVDTLLLHIKEFWTKDQEKYLNRKANNFGIKQ